MVTTADAHPGAATAGDTRRWAVLGVLCLAMTTITIDNTILNVALPSIVSGLHASGSELQWMVDAYVIVFACLLLTSGALGDRFGRRRSLLFGLAWFCAFSGLASFANSPSHLIVSRGLMGVGAAFIFPTTLSILTNVFQVPSERSRAIGIWAGVSGVGIALGPPLGGFLVEHFGWHAVFWINVPLCAVTFVAAAMFVPPTAKSPHKLDPIGAVLSIVGLVALLWAIIEAPDAGWTDPTVLVAFGAGMAVLAGFAWWEATYESPMLAVQFFKNPRFSAASATITIMTFAMYASMFLLTQYFQFTLGYSPLKAGVMLMPVALGLMVSSPQTPKLVFRYGTKRVVVIGLGTVAAAMACYGSNTIMSTVLGGLGVRFVYGIAMGFIGPPVTESIMGSLPPERAGVGSAVNDTTRQVGGALGVAVLGSVFAANYHSIMDQAVGIPAGLRATARESMGRTLQVASATNDPAEAARIRDAGLHAFHSSMRITYAIAVVIVLGAMAVAWKWLPANAVDHAPMRRTDEVDEALLVS